MILSSDHHGELCELCKPMLLCSLEGPEGGIGNDLGKKPRIVRGE